MNKIYDMLTLWLPLLTSLFFWVLIIDMFSLGGGYRELLISRIDDRIIFGLMGYALMGVYRLILMATGGQDEPQQSKPDTR